MSDTEINLVTLPKNQLVTLAAVWRKRLQDAQKEAVATQAALTELRLSVERLIDGEMDSRDRNWVDLAAEWRRKQLEGNPP